MKRLVALLVIGITLSTGISMAETVGYADRLRIILDLIKDGEVTTAANYADTELDYLAALTALKYAESFYNKYGPVWIGGEAKSWEDLTNAQRSAFMINKIRLFIREVRHADLDPVAAQSAYDTQKATTETEIDTDLGTEE